MDLRETEILGEDASGHWYYVSKGRVLVDLLSDSDSETLLDVGAGSCIFSKLLLERGKCAQAICVDTSYERDANTDYLGKPLTKRRKILSSDSKIVLMIDVLEHVERDASVLRDYVEMSPDGSTFLVTVPAFQFLWSDHDEFLKHYRRYTRQGAVRLLESAGLTVVTSRYYFGLVLPVAILVRGFERLVRRHRKAPARSSLRKTPAWLNRLLIMALDLERKLIFPLNGIGGLTVVCKARKGSS